MPVVPSHTPLAQLAAEAHVAPAAREATQILVAPLQDVPFAQWSTVQSSPSPTWERHVPSPEVIGGCSHQPSTHSQS